ncbi:DEAD/DEAH box helicase family protein [Candidatus Saccharibacteria bacterium]|nr:DEAD/DEAH box helicase family protein [Candidatus Saccharibacteria bacterium]
MNPPILPTPPATLTLQPDRVNNLMYLDNLEHYIADGNKSDILYTHQKAIISDTANFLRGGHRRGYIEAPTGTGKTVLFVTLAEAFSYGAATPPKILVVTPTKDLVRQTLGGSRGDKGFAGFAPTMSVGTFYSDTLTSMRGLDAQVTITTYASLAKLAATPMTTVDEQGTSHTKLVNLVDERFDIIFLDEGHKALGANSRRIIDEISPQTLIIGFTATPDYHASRGLESLLPVLIHRLDLKEAITLDMLSSVIPVAIPAPTTTAQEFSIGALGEYENKSLRQLIHNPARNRMVVAIAAQLIQAGNTPIIACIPGDTMAHPHLIADLLSSQFIEDDYGIPRPIRVSAITSAISAAARQKIYAELEKGTIDALTYIDVLTEGWDSQRANVIINARPTRSLVSARQRTGRILRNKPDGRPALAIDIVDVVASNTAPQVSMADIFTVKSIANGVSIGDIEPAHAAAIKQSIDDLFVQYGAIETIANTYTVYAELLETLPHLTRGQAAIKQNGVIRTFASAGRLFTRLNVDSFSLEHLKQQHDIEIRMVRRYHEAIEAYDEEQIQSRLAGLPNAVHTGMGLKVGDTSYISLNELVNVINQKYSFVDATYRAVESMAHEIVKTDSQLYFTKRFRARTHRGIMLYTAQTMVTIAVGQAIVANFRGE